MRALGICEGALEEQVHLKMLSEYDRLRMMPSDEGFKDL